MIGYFGDYIKLGCLIGGNGCASVPFELLLFGILVRRFRCDGYGDIITTSKDPPPSSRADRMRHITHEVRLLSRSPSEEPHNQGNMVTLLICLLLPVGYIDTTTRGWDNQELSLPLHFF
jgi:hypothetical protein